ncbi:MAG: YbaN family protein [Anaerolineaceae bacterium]
MRKTTKQYLFIGLGSLSVALAAIGLFLPVLPTTPFLLLAAFFFTNSSDGLYQWLVRHPYFGKYLVSYLKFKAVDPRVKTQALIILWVGLIASGLLMQNNWLRAGLLVIGIGVTLHISSLKPLTPEQLQELETNRFSGVSEESQD